ncbi:MAG: hypothetical protein ACPGYT_11690 [Nitrospirales bacterium]
MAKDKGHSGGDEMCLIFWFCEPTALEGRLGGGLRNVVTLIIILADMKHLYLKSVAVYDTCCMPNPRFLWVM